MKTPKCINSLFSLVIFECIGLWHLKDVTSIYFSDFPKYVAVNSKEICILKSSDEFWFKDRTCNKYTQSKCKHPKKHKQNETHKHARLMMNSDNDDYFLSFVCLLQGHSITLITVESMKINQKS